MKFLTPILLLGMSIAIFFWFISPHYANIKVLTAQGNDYAKALSRAKNALTERDNLVSKYHAISTDNLNRLNQALPSTVDPLRLIVETNAMAQKYGANIYNIKVGDNLGQTPTTVAVVSSAAQPVAVPISFTVSLTYTNFLKFLSDIEQNLRITDISTIDFTPTDSGIYDFSFTLKTYKLK